MRREVFCYKKNSKVIWKFTSSFPADEFGSLNYRVLGTEKVLALNFFSASFSKKMKFFVGGREDLFRWLSVIGRYYNSLQEGS